MHGRCPGALGHRESARENSLLDTSPVDLLTPHLRQQADDFVFLFLGQGWVSERVECTARERIVGVGYNNSRCG